MGIEGGYGIKPSTNYQPNWYVIIDRDGALVDGFERDDNYEGDADWCWTVQPEMTPENFGELQFQNPKSDDSREAAPAWWLKQNGFQTFHVHKGNNPCTDFQQVFMAYEMRKLFCNLGQTLGKSPSVSSVNAMFTKDMSASEWEDLRTEYLPESHSIETAGAPYSTKLGDHFTIGPTGIMHCFFTGMAQSQTLADYFIEIMYLTNQNGVVLDAVKVAISNVLSNITPTHPQTVSNNGRTELAPRRWSELAQKHLVHKQRSFVHDTYKTPIQALRVALRAIIDSLRNSASIMELVMDGEGDVLSALDDIIFYDIEAGNW